MAIGTSRENTIASEKSGWGAFFTTIKTNALAGATTLVLNGQGGSDEGCALVTTGMKVAFLDDTTEGAKLISNVTVSSGDATLTIPALTNAQNAGKEVVVGYFPTEALLADSFSSTKNNNKWSPQPYSGTRAKNTSRVKGRIEAEGSIEFMLRPSVNSILIAKAIGQDRNVIGTDPTVPTTTTLSAQALAGATTATVTSATGLVANEYVQFETGSNAEVRKIVSVATNTLTLDTALDFTHASGSAVKEVIAPFIHVVPSAASQLSSFALEDFVPWDDELNTPSLISTRSYYLPGCMAKSLKVESQSEQGATVSIDYMAQDKVKIKKSTSIAIPNENPYTFNQEAVLIAGTRKKRITEISIEVDNDPQKAFAKNGSNRALKISAGTQEVKGSLKFLENETDQQTFWDALRNDTQLALVWTITDPVTGYYTKFDVPKVVIDDFQDGDFSPADLIYGSLNWTAVLDAGVSNVQITVTIANGNHLPYR